MASSSSALSTGSSGRSRKGGRPLKFNPPGRASVGAAQTVVNFVAYPDAATAQGARSSPKKPRAASLNDLQQPQDGGLISAAALSQQRQHMSAPPSDDPSRLKMATAGLLEVFEACNEAFRFDRSLNPRRVLTKPARPVHNGGFDNEKHDYILYVNDVLGSEEGKRYTLGGVIIGRERLMRVCVCV